MHPCACVTPSSEELAVEPERSGEVLTLLLLMSAPRAPPCAGEFAQINKRYSEDLTRIINEMIVVDPQKRVDSAYVCKISDEMIATLRKSPRIDCILVNEDIYEKLSLVEYHKYFCVPLGRKPVSKVYFAVDDSDKKQDANKSATEKFFYFVELSYWIMSIPKVHAAARAS